MMSGVAIWCSALLKMRPTAAHRKAIEAPVDSVPRHRNARALPGAS